jgi:hypothetical protein
MLMVIKKTSLMNHTSVITTKMNKAIAGKRIGQGEKNNKLKTTTICIKAVRRTKLSFDIFRIGSSSL